MKKAGKFLLGLLLFAPFGASAIAPAVVALIAGAVAVAGFSIYRSVQPVNMGDALQFFSSCWSCGMFSDILKNLADFIPRIYDAVGSVMIPILAGLTFVWFAWLIISDYIHVRGETNAWKLTGAFGVHLIKLTFVGALLLFPLPKFMMDTFVAPVMNVGLSYNYIARSHIQPDDTSFETCLIATALQDGGDPAVQAFSPKLRNNVACQIAEFHKITGLGMTVGWTFMNMGFRKDYMFHAGPVPVFPNVMLIFAGLAILLMFLWALLPVPLYFLEVFIKLAMDMIMLPLMLLSWLFKDRDGKDWEITKLGEGNIKRIVDDAVKGTCGIALVGLFTGFAVLFLNEVVGVMDGADGLVYALQNNDSEFMMNALSFNNNAMANIIFAGIFVGMFMNAIPKLITELFKNVDVEKIFQNAKEWQKDIATVAQNLKKSVEDKIKALGPPPPPPTP